LSLREIAPIHRGATRPLCNIDLRTAPRDDAGIDDANELLDQLKLPSIA
jgi:hypothetical protein